MLYYSGMFAIVGVSDVATAWTISGVALPCGPSGLRLPKTAEKDSLKQTGDLPLNVYDGVEAFDLTLTGTIADAAKSDADIWEDVIAPLLALVGTEITLICPITALNGEWGFDSFTPERDSAQPIYRYTMKFSKGLQTVVISEVGED